MLKAIRKALNLKELNRLTKSIARFPLDAGKVSNRSIYPPYTVTHEAEENGSLFQGYRQKPKIEG